MSVFVQEVLSLLKRNFVKTSLNPTDDYFQFVRKGAFSRAKASAGGFAPAGQSLLISAGSWLCSQTGPQGLGRFASVVKESGEEAGVIPMFWLKQGQCNWHSLKDSLLTQDSAESTIYVGRPKAVEASLVVSDKAYIPKLNAGAIGDPGRIPFALPSPNFGALAGELDSNVNFTFKEITPGSAMFTVGEGVSSSFGFPQQNPPLSYDPATNVRIYSNLLLDARVYDRNQDLGVGPTGGNPQGVGGMLLRSRADGTVQWTTGSVAGLPDLQFGELIVGYQNPTPTPGTIVPAVGSFTGGAIGVGNVNEVLVSGGPNGMPTWAPNPSIGGIGTLYQIPLFTPDGVTISDSLMSQDGDVFNGPKPLTVTNGIYDVANPGLAGNFINTGKMTLLDVEEESSNLTERILCLYNDPNDPNNPENGQIKWRPKTSVGVSGSGTHKRVPLWTPNEQNIKDSLLLQSDDIQPNPNDPNDPAFIGQLLTNDGKLRQRGEVKLDTVSNDPSLVTIDTQVLVRDVLDQNRVKWKSALSIGGGVKGWDTVDPDTGGADWNVVFYNGYMELSTTPTGAFRAIRPNNLINANEGYFVFLATAGDIPKDYLLFTGVNGSTANTVRTTWSGSIANNFVYVPTNLDSTGQFWAQGTAVKFHYILRIDPQGNQVIWWDACCEVQSTNTCPVANDTFFISNEDTPISGLQMPSTDADPGDILTWSVTQPPTSEGVVTFDSTTGAYTFTPALNYCGTGTFTWTTNDGICDSNIGTVTYTIACQCDSPIFAVSNGVGNACGAASVPPTYSGVLGSTYTWNGDYCDIDNPATDVTIVVYHSLNGGTTWTLGFKVVSGSPEGTLTQNTSASTFVFNIPATSAGNTLYKIEMCDSDPTCCSEYILSLTAATAILERYELQVTTTNTDTGSVSRIPYAQNTNLGMFGADPGPYACNDRLQGANWQTFMNQIYPSSKNDGLAGGYAKQYSTLGGGSGYPVVSNAGPTLLTVGCATTTAIAPSVGTGMTVYYSNPLSGAVTYTLTTGGTGYTNGAQTNVATTYAGAGSGATVNYTGVGNAITVPTLGNSGGSGYSVGDVLTVAGGGGNGTITVASVASGAIAAQTTVTCCPGEDWNVGDTFIINGGSNDVIGEITLLTSNPPSQRPRWGNWGDVRGKILTNRSTVPSNMDTSGILNNSRVDSISPSGGTYPGVSTTATFQLVNMVAELPNPNPGTREIFVFAHTIPADDNIAVGQTIIFDAATLNTAFAAKIAAGNNPGFTFTGDLICTIEEEDISYKPYATNSIEMAPVNSTAHACNDGGYKMTASITDGAGQTRTLTIGRFSVANVKILNVTEQRYTKDDWEIPNGFINSTDGREWTRASSQSSWGQVNYPYIIDKQYIDTTRRGKISNQVNSTYNNNAAYINQQKMMSAWWEAFTTSGAKRIPAADRSFIAANSANGDVDFKLIGDTWVNTYHNSGVVKTIRGLIAGSGYVDGTYSTTNNNFVPGSPSTGGFDCKIAVTTSAGAVVGVTISASGARYAVNDVLTIIGGNSDASVIVNSVGVGVDGTVKVTGVLAGGVIDTVVLQTTGDPYATFQGDDVVTYPFGCDTALTIDCNPNPVPSPPPCCHIQTANIPAEFMAIGGSGDQKAQIQCGISGASVKDFGIVFARQYLSGTFTVTNGGTGYQVGDLLTISADNTWVAKTHSDAAEFRMFHKGDKLIKGHVFNTIGGVNTGYPANQTAPNANYYTFTTTGNSTGGFIFINTDNNGSITSAQVPNVPQWNPNLTGQNFAAGDVLTINTVMGVPGNATITLTSSDINDDQAEIFNGPPYNNTGSLTNTAFVAGDGTAVRINIFTGAVQIV